MSGEGTGWSVRLSDLAERDIRDIAAWTQNQFGPVQAERYAGALVLTIDLLLRGPRIPGVRERAEIDRGLFSLRVRQKRWRGRHLIFFRVAGREIAIVRVLHDAIDIDRHLNDDSAAESSS